MNKMQNMDVNELIVHLAHCSVVISLFSSPVGAKATENISLNKCIFWGGCCYTYR